MLATRQLALPALTERSSDLPDLFRELWRRHAGRQITISPEIGRTLRQLAWPGDLAQLETEVRRLVAEHPAADRLRRSWLRRQLELDTRRDLQAESFEGTLAQVERRLLERALRLADGNKSQAARSLQMSRTGFYRRLQRHGLWTSPRTRSEDDESAEPG
jgi:DNA-binding NtrC family response regulator